MLRWTPQIRMQRGLDRTAEWFLAAGFAGQAVATPD